MQRANQSDQMVMSARKKFKVVVVGASGVGKSYILHRLVHGTYPEVSTIVPTVGSDLVIREQEIDFATKSDPDNLSRGKLLMHIFDTSGQERYGSITHAHYKAALGAVVVYSVDDRQSFERVPWWIESLQDKTDSMC